MPAFVAPIKNSGSSQPENVTNEFESASSIENGKVVKNLEEKNNPFESCLQALKSASSSKVIEDTVFEYNQLQSLTEEGECSPKRETTNHLSAVAQEKVVEESPQTVKTSKKKSKKVSNHSKKPTNKPEIQKVKKNTNERKYENKENISHVDGAKKAKTTTKGKRENRDKEKAKTETKSLAALRKVGKNIVNVTKKTNDASCKKKPTTTIMNMSATFKEDTQKTTQQQHDSSQSASQNIEKDNVTASQEISCSQASNFSSVFTKMILSQAPKYYTHKQRMEWLQERRQVGLWVQCNKPDCLKWRYLPHIHDPTSLPEVWYCYMNPDARANECSKKERKIKLREEEDCIHGHYSAGSLVWGHLHGFPWWPAIVDDDPDTEQFYWLDGFSDIPTYYHVTFFDSEKVTRAWLTPNNLKPFTVHGVFNDIKNIKVSLNLSNRLKYAIGQAKGAIDLTILEKLKKYSFISLYKGPINKPKGKKELKMLRKRHREMSSSESDSSDSEETESQIIISKKKHNKSSMANMLETELSQSTMVSLEDLIMYENTGDKHLESEVDATSTSRTSETSTEIPLQPIIRVQSSDMKNMQENCIIPETYQSSFIESTENQESQDISAAMDFDAVVPSTEFDVQNMTESFTQNSIQFESY